MKIYSKGLLFALIGLSISNGQANKCPPADYLKMHLGHLVMDQVLQYDGKMYAINPHPEKKNIQYHIKNLDDLKKFNLDSTSERRYIKAPDHPEAFFGGEIKQPQNDVCHYELNFYRTKHKGTRSETYINFIAFMDLEEKESNAQNQQDITFRPLVCFEGLNSNLNSQDCPNNKPPAPVMND